MKTILLTFVAGLFISLITVPGLHSDLTGPSETSEIHNFADGSFDWGAAELINLDRELELLEFEIFETFDTAVTLMPDDIEVYEIEEEINIDFDTHRFLPTGFNPYEGMGTVDELDFEAQLTLSALIRTVETEAPVEIEDLEIIEIEEEVVFDYDIQRYLPEGFDPYKEMTTDISFEYEIEQALKALVTADKDEIVSIQEIIVFELEEESL